MDTMRKIKLILSFLTLMSLSLSAQDFKVMRGDCMPQLAMDGGADMSHAGMKHILPVTNTKWDPEKIYKQLVILIEFKLDSTFFQNSNPRELYNRIFNEYGYNQRNGVGCVADYFRDQSEGLFNLSFDVYGPYKINSKSQPYSNPNANTRNYGASAAAEATRLFLAENPDIDFSQYDWDNDGKVDQVIYVYAGLPGNLSLDSSYGRIWPNTGIFSTITTKDNHTISKYSSSGEYWPTASKASCGIGTICHEFTHCLGLPDIYPTAANNYASMLDEWDLMDGGNFTNYGWCPPNFTPLEKWLLGWLSFTDIDEPATIKGMKPVADGGEVYRIKHSDSEWLLLENKQRKGWDAGNPGSGLLIYHVNYDNTVWRNNSVNIDDVHPRFVLVNADNHDYNYWNSYIASNNLSTYVNAGHMNSRFLSMSAYPLLNDNMEIVNDELTDTSVPAAEMFYPNLEEKTILAKPITNIRVSDDGLVSFDYMGGATTGITEHTTAKTSISGKVMYDLSGRNMPMSKTCRGIYFVRSADGTVVKQIRKQR